MSRRRVVVSGLLLIVLCVGLERDLHADGIARGGEDGPIETAPFVVGVKGREALLEAVEARASAAKVCEDDPVVHAHPLDGEWVLPRFLFLDGHCGSDQAFNVLVFQSADARYFFDRVEWLAPGRRAQRGFGLEPPSAATPGWSAVIVDTLTRSTTLPVDVCLHADIDSGRCSCPDGGHLSHLRVLLLCQVDDPASPQCARVQLLRDEKRFDPCRGEMIDYRFEQLEKLEVRRDVITLEGVPRRVVEGRR